MERDFNEVIEAKYKSFINENLIDVLFINQHKVNGRAHAPAQYTHTIKDSKALTSNTYNCQVINI